MGGYHHTPGHHVDLLFLATPLRGDFEVTCELTTFGWREGRISYGGTSIGLNWSWKEFEVQRYGRWTEANGLINPPLKEGGDWYPSRLVVKDGRRTTYAQGRKLDDRAVTGEADPWLALFSSASLTSGVRNLKVAGRPSIPDQVVLSNSSDLTGWLGDYYGEATQGDDAAWKKRGDEIVGRRLRHESGPTSNQGVRNSPATTGTTGRSRSRPSSARSTRPCSATPARSPRTAR